MGFVDLHVHSNASDGTFSPSQVVELAKNAGLDAFALTDHDTTAGVPEALEKGRDLNIEVIPGIEVSSSFDGTEIHILGLFVNSDDPVLAAMLEKMRISRDRRNEKMLENLAADGISFTKEEICGDNPDTIITRAHIAHALVAKGICSGMDQAFKKYLQYGGRYCPQKEHLSPEEVVKTLISNGAFVALAHPFQYKFGDKKTEELIAHMADLGMKGLEVYHFRKWLSDITCSQPAVPTSTAGTNRIFRLVQDGADSEFLPFYWKISNVKEQNRRFHKNFAKNHKILPLYQSLIFVIMQSLKD